MTTTYRNPHVNNLAWAIASPPLLLPGEGECTWYSNDWYRRAGIESTRLLEQADRYPRRLEAMLASPRDRRLGKYYETLWAYWLCASPRYEVLAQNLQISDSGRTLGELDFIVLDKVTGKCLHWEVAVKFYLGRGDTRLQRNWIGPDNNDRLDIKIGHLMNRQVKFGTHPRVREWCDQRGIHIDACAVILKGRLFYPFDEAGQDARPQDANPRHLRGRWLTPGRFCREYSSVQYYFTPLIHGNWMATTPSLASHRAYRAEVLIGMIESGELGLPLQVCIENTSTFGDRLFIVDDEWPDEGRT